MDNKKATESSVPNTAQTLPHIESFPHPDDPVTRAQRHIPFRAKRFWIAGIILVVLLCIGGYFLYAQWSQGRRGIVVRYRPAKVKVRTSEKRNKRKKQAASMPDLKAYSSAPNGFRLVYPSSWHVEDNDPTILTLFSKSGEVIQAGTDENKEGLPFDTWFAQNYPEDFRKTFSKTTIDGQQAMVSNAYKAAYIYLPSKNVLAVTYTECEEVNCKPGSKDIPTYQSILDSITINKSQ